MSLFGLSCLLVRTESRWKFGRYVEVLEVEVIHLETTLVIRQCLF